MNASSMFHRTLAGGAGGITGWFAGMLLALAGEDTLASLEGGEGIPLATTVCIATGLFVSITTRKVDDSRQNPIEMLLVGLLGLVAGAAIGYGSALVFGSMGDQTLGRVVVTVLIGVVVGAVAGLNIDDPRGAQVGLTAAGGLVGGLVGGVIQLLTPEDDLLAQAACWTAAIAFVGLFSAILPEAVSGAILVYEASSHEKSKAKYSSPRRQWPLPSEASMELGSDPKLAQPNARFIDTQGVAPRHARIRHARDQGYTVERHPECGNKTLQVDEREVTAAVRLRDGAKLTIGSMTVRFHLKRGKKAA